METIRFARRPGRAKEEEPELTDRAFRKNWARLIQKIYEIDPLLCPRCQGAMRVIAFIEDEGSTAVFLGGFCGKIHI